MNDDTVASLIGATLIATGIAIILTIVSAYEEAIVEPPCPPISLPEKCQEFYNDGTDNWIECMGVEYK